MKVGIGIVGLGYWGPNLLKNFHQLEGCEVLYCCDKDEKRLSLIARQYPAIKITTDYYKVLKESKVTAVVIATPTDTHSQLVKEALMSGKHVLVEKPLTLSVKSAEKLVRLAKRKKKILMVGHTYEYHPAILKIQNYISTKMIGQINYIYCSRVNLGKVREETNALWNLAPHDISILHLLIKSTPTAVSAFGQSYFRPKHEDVVFINLRFPKNIIAHVHVSWLDPSKIRKMTIVGSDKMITFDDMDNEASVRIYDKGIVRLVNEEGDRIYKEFSLKLRAGDVHLPHIDPTEPLKAECEHFVESIRKKRTPRSDGKVGLEVVRVLEAAQKSLEQGGAWIKLH